jgi:4-hydroxy-tetrahydrodipicolinate reductase
VTFAGAGEVVELKHQGFSREIYAVGALQAALWAAAQPAGLYSMRDVMAAA